MNVYSFYTFTFQGAENRIQMSRTYISEVCGYTDEREETMKNHIRYAQP